MKTLTIVTAILFPSGDNFVSNSYIETNDCYQEIVSYMRDINYGDNYWIDPHNVVLVTSSYGGHVVKTLSCN